MPKLLTPDRIAFWDLSAKPFARLWDTDSLCWWLVMAIGFTRLSVFFFPHDGGGGDDFRLRGGIVFFGNRLWVVLTHVCFKSYAKKLYSVVLSF